MDFGYWPAVSIHMMRCDSTSPIDLPSSDVAIQADGLLTSAFGTDCTVVASLVILVGAKAEGSAWCVLSKVGEGGSGKTYDLSVCAMLGFSSAISTAVGVRRDEGSPKSRVL